MYNENKETIYNDISADPIIRKRKDIFVHNVYKRRVGEKLGFLPWDKIIKPNLMRHPSEVTNEISGTLQGTFVNNPYVFSLRKRHNGLFPIKIWDNPERLL